MKYLILLSILCLTLSLKAQTTSQAHPIKKDSAKYQYFIQIPINDYKAIYGAMEEYKRLTMYDPASSDPQKVASFKNIEAYLKELPSRVKLDSVRVK